MPTSNTQTEVASTPIALAPISRKKYWPAIWL